MQSVFEQIIYKRVDYRPELFEMQIWQGNFLRHNVERNSVSCSKGGAMAASRDIVGGDGCGH